MKTNNNVEKSQVAIAFFNPNMPGSESIAQEALSKAVGSYTGFSSNQGMFTARGGRSLYEDESPNISIRNQFTRQAYESFRPNERIPTKPREIMAFSNQAYRRVGLVRNIIDLMGDFTVQGIKIVHPNKTQQALYRAWWHKINGDIVSERFANLLYRLGNVAIQRWTGKLTQNQQRKMMSLGVKLEANDNEWNNDYIETKNRVIPTRYNFLNPMSLEIAGGELAQFVGKQTIALKITQNLRNKITSPKNELERELIKKIPSNIIKAAKSGNEYIVLDSDRISIFHYKKDDWQSWADPITYAAMDDLIILEKMKLADLAALDGAISQIRIWKLGDLDKGILPTDAAIEKLSDILLSNPGGGAFDLIWGPDLKVENYKTDVHQFLGASKYEPTLNSLYETYGVPPTLSGNSTKSGTTNNFISMETLIERLKYGRKVLRQFWMQEIEIFRQAMGLNKGAKIVFDHNTLTDRNAERAILIDLWDRDLLSDETLLDRLEEDDAMEIIRKRREKREREKGSRGAKAGPYYTAEKLHEYIKLSLQRGYINPEDADIEIMSDKTPPFDRQLDAAKKKMPGGNPQGKLADPSKNNPGQPGRKKNQIDSPSGRSNRTFKVRTSAENNDGTEDTALFLTKMSWAKQAQEKISETIQPAILAHYGKKTLRELSKEETAAIEKAKFKILSYLHPFEEITKECIAEITSSEYKIPSTFTKCKNSFIHHIKEKTGREPNTEEMRTIQAAVYSLLIE